MNRTAHQALKGFSLIELLVAMAIGLVVTLVITRVLMLSEGSKRTSTALNDTVQSGAYSSFVLERAIRQAGTGYTQKVNDLFGCRVNASRVSLGGRVLPAAAPFDAPFAAAAQLRRLVPVLIEKGAADSGGEIRGDIITVLSGAGGKSEMPLRATSFNPALPMSFSLPFTGEYNVGDLVLIGGDRAAGDRECMVQQVAAISGKSLVLGGDYFSATGTTVNFADFAAMSVVHAAQIGKGQPPLPAPQTPPNPPLFQMFAVGDNNTLFALDLLKTGSTAIANQPQPISDNVVEVRALYGIDTDTIQDRTINTWWDPATSPYTYAELSSGVGALGRLKRISSIRLGLITRSPVQEKLRDDGTPVSPQRIVLFPGLVSSGGAQLQYVRTLTADERNFRYRTYETVIPLRNMQFAPLP